MIFQRKKSNLVFVGQVKNGLHYLRRLCKKEIVYFKNSPFTSVTYAVATRITSCGARFYSAEQPRKQRIKKGAEFSSFKNIKKKEHLEGKRTWKS